MNGRGTSKLILVCLLLATVAAFARSADILPNPAIAQRLSLPRLEKAPALEDFLDMKPNAAWAGKLTKVDQFVQRTPTDGAPVSQRTEAYLGYDYLDLGNFQLGGLVAGVRLWF